MGYRIGSFNLHNLGLTALSQGENGRDLETIARIIQKEHLHVVALQEILSGGKAFTGIGDKKGIERSILEKLGKNWGFQWADVSKDGMSADNRREGYAFLWDKRMLRLVEGTLPYAYHRKETREMARLPYCARFRNLSGPLIELRLICIHTHYGKDTAEDRMRRKKKF